MTVASPGRRSVVTILTTLILTVVVVLAWAFTGTTEAPVPKIALFVTATAALFAAFGRRWPWPMLVVTGFMALTARPFVPGPPDAWSLVFIGCTSLGLAMSLREWKGLDWIAASFPFWVFANASPWAMAAALGLTIGGVARRAVLPTLPARRSWRGGTPLPQLASGPRTLVQARTFPGARKSRPLQFLTVAALVVSVVLFAMIPALQSAGRRDEAQMATAFVLVSLIIASTFAFANWFAGRVHVRIDATGVHGRTMFREYTIPWTDVVALDLRYLFLPIPSARLVYYTVRSPSCEVSFPSSMAGAAELQAAIERATGEKWPEPEFTATM